MKTRVRTDLGSGVHSTAHNGKNLERIQMSIKCRVGEQNILQRGKGTLSRNKKELPAHATPRMSPENLTPQKDGVEENTLHLHGSSPKTKLQTQWV